MSLLTLPMPNFTPDYGYSLEQLLQIEPPHQPDDFVSFWQNRYFRSLETDTQPVLKQNDLYHPDYACYDLHFRSTDAFEIGGWALIPKALPVTRGIIVGHGYGGREEPDFDLPITNAVFFFPCFRGISRSRHQSISDNPNHHVLHQINSRDHYIFGGCVADLWLAVSALLALFPNTKDHIAYLGISFGGGIGALALPWEARIKSAHFNVPSFGNHPLRLKLPTFGSAAAVQNYQREHGNVLATLQYYDAAVAARHIQVPVHLAAALADPVVAPPGQFSIYNALPGNKKLFLLDCGHSEYPRQAAQKTALLSELQEFFKAL